MKGILEIAKARGRTLALSGGCDSRELSALVVRTFPQAKQNPYLHQQIGVSEFNLDDDLLSHGETPHYHRRCIVSLLSSG
ncbi:hypothetical protein, partial [Pseudomonas sp. WCS365]|uniref:hypothetical protein n=1 Tax=Pseudomonas sp. WCS365 TaxID=2054929 RepID=UPI001C43B04C